MLGMQALCIEDSTGTTLRCILECPILRKTVFDVRNGSDILLDQYKDILGGIEDIQLMELATRNGSKEYVRGLVTCVRNDSPLSKDDKAVTLATTRLAEKSFLLRKCRVNFFSKLLGKERLSGKARGYCTHSVAVLPGLYDSYVVKLNRHTDNFWRYWLHLATKGRINLTQQPAFNIYSRKNAYGPGMMRQLKMKGQRGIGAVWMNMITLEA
ncbi:hypothetical protein MauCBS54593_000367 [Microsporum audouinii]